MLKKFLITIVLIFSITSCETSEDNKLFGQILGAGLGVLVGYQFGSGIGGALSIAGGTIIGGLIGGEIAELLNENENLQYGQATEEVLENSKDNETANWKSEDNKNLSGEITPLASFEKEGKYCRNVRQTINDDNSKKAMTSTFCRDDNGNWLAI
jgi:surface antigen